MIITAAGLGNSREAYFDNDFSEHFNIIYSFGNHKGKTILMQSIMFALGNKPIFPAIFVPDDYYYFVSFVQNGKQYSVCRRHNSFAVLHDGHLDSFSKEEDFRTFFDKEIFSLPIIYCFGKSQTSDLELFYQLFFVGQDDRKTSTIFNPGRYDKNDFQEMVYSFSGIPSFVENENKMQDLLEKKKRLLYEKKELMAKQKVFLKAEHSSSALSYCGDQKNFEDKKNLLDDKNRELSELFKKRNKCYLNISRNQNFLSELKSIGKLSEKGKFVCRNCGSEDIDFLETSKSIPFNVSDSEIRSQIVNLVNQRITDGNKELDELSILIRQKQDEIKTLLNEPVLDPTVLIAFSPALIDSKALDERIRSLDESVKALDSGIDDLGVKQTTDKSEREALIAKLSEEMMGFYKKLEPNGVLAFDGLFTKSGKTYSGSEGCEFYLSKIFAIAKVFGHNFPLIIDCFRNDELDTQKENIAILEYSKLPNQIIFTCTLKAQEKGKYDQFKFVKQKDFTQFDDNHILSPKYVEEFSDQMRKMGISL